MTRSAIINDDVDNKMKSFEIISRHRIPLSEQRKNDVAQTAESLTCCTNFAENAWQTRVHVFILLKKDKIIPRKRHIKRATEISYNTIRANYGLDSVHQAVRLTVFSKIIIPSTGSGFSLLRCRNSARTWAGMADEDGE
jgi:hypothetical protein